MAETSTRKILLAVSGMSPQIITETLYALIRDAQWIPDEVCLVTTLEGKQRARLQLLEGEKYFQQLLSDYPVEQPIAFSEAHITLIADAGGQPLADLRTPQDNEAAADTICAVIRELTSDQNTELHVSLAGGRKTMGFYAGYALSLFGRPQDRLSHVLVSEHYESNPQFFYPTPRTKIIHSRDGRVLDASEARVWLAEIPYVRLRSQLPTTLTQGTHTFSETVRLAREATESVKLVLRPASLSYSVNGLEGRLSPGHMALMLWAAVRQCDQAPPIEPVVEGEKRSAVEFLTLAKRYQVSLNGRTEQNFGVNKHDYSNAFLTKAWIETNVSKLNRCLTETVGPALAERCKLASRTINGARGYALPENLNIQIDAMDAETK